MPNSTGNKIVTYTYDAYGYIDNILGSKAHSIGDLNPFRYRGYYYDDETEYYYLNSRYYDPYLGRFLNADSQLNSDTILGHNMFTYCENNPVMFYDPTGHRLAPPPYSFIIRLPNSEPIEEKKYFLADKREGINDEKINTKVPPNPESGYVPPKKNPSPEKVKNPNGQGKGWPANDGGVWIPDNNQDGGPGWTVQYPGGNHEHRYPSGHVRTHKTSDVQDILLGGVMVFSASVLIIAIVADDFTGVGAGDDFALPAVIGMFSEGLAMIGE